jgi:hypothetical protein
VESEARLKPRQLRNQRGEALTELVDEHVIGRLRVVAGNASASQASSSRTRFDLADQLEQTADKRIVA